MGAGRARCEGGEGEKGAQGVVGGAETGLVVEEEGGPG